jgi:spore germination protein YaaH
VSVHHAELLAHEGAPTHPDLLGSGKEALLPLQRVTTATGPCKTVFGYLPYWESSANIQWDKITHVACFSVGVNSNGTLGNDHSWPWTSVINTAHANGVKVVLVATLFSDSGIYTLITTPAYKNAFFVNIKNKMLEGGADGLNIDFEGSSSSWISLINGFMADLTAYIHTEIPGSEVTFAGPAVNWSNRWNLLGLAQSCDGIFIMGYAFAGSWSSTSGPNAPLVGGSINITDTVTDEYGDVTAAMPEKLILGVPYYGNRWKTVSSTARSSVISYVGSTRFRDDEGLSQAYGVQWETLSQTPWYRWHDGSNWNQVWFDNADSLQLKYELADAYNLQGIGMWALNYDGTRSELWDVIDQMYVSGCAPPIPGDFDDDGDVDLSDYGDFLFCYSGPGQPLPIPECSVADFDEDNDVDLTDYGVFLGCYNGPNNPPACQ